MKIPNKIVQISISPGNEDEWGTVYALAENGKIYACREDYCSYQNAEWYEVSLTLKDEAK